MRPLLKPALRRVWRDRGTLQIGLDADLAVVIGGLDDGAAAFVETLDGTRDLPGVLEAAGAHGLSERQARHLVEMLESAGLLEDAAADRRALAMLPIEDRDALAPDLATLSLLGTRTAAGERRVSNGSDGGVGALLRRRRSGVLIVGAGRIGATVASLLAAAGIGHILVQDNAPTRPADLSPGGLDTTAVRQSREQGVRARLSRRHPALRQVLPPGRPPDAAVLAPVGMTPVAVAEDLLRSGVPHLLVTVREVVGRVGPFVVPGQSSCLHCADLHRGDRDAAWPRLAAQLAADPPGPVAACDIGLATLVAAQAAQQVLAFLDGTGRPATVDGTLETRLPAGATRRRSWMAHPGCGCTWRQAS